MNTQKAGARPIETAGLPDTNEVGAEIIDLTEEFAREQADNAGKPSVEPEFFNDAQMLGSASAVPDDFLSTPATFLLGEMWGTRDKRNTQDEAWKSVTMPWSNWIIGGTGDKNTPAWGLSRHPVAREKAGACIVLGSSIGGARKAKAMDTMYAMGLDIDSGASLDAVLNKVEDLGLFCLVYTTFSHGRRGLQLKRDEVLRKLGIKTEPSLDQVKDYLRTHEKSRYEESFIAAVTIKTAKKQVKEGVVIELDTPPLEKFRLIFPLAQPVKIIDLAETHEAALDVWEDKITGLAQNVLGVTFDAACTDPSRLFYTARHAKDADDWYCAVVQGKPIDFATIPPMKRALYTQNRAGDVNPFTLAGGGDLNQIPDAFTPSGASLNDWHRTYKDRFLLANLLEDYCPDKIRNAGGEAEGHVHTECPFEGQHTSEGGTGTMAINCIDSQNEYWTWFCQHEGCKPKHKLLFLEEALRAGWFDESVLFDPDSGYMLEGPKEDEDELTATACFEMVKDWLPKSYKISGGVICLRGEGDEQDRPLTGVFDVVGRASNLTGDAGTGRIIHFTNENGVSVEMTLHMSDLIRDSGAGVLEALADAGLTLYVGSRNGREAVLNLFRQITPKRHIPTVPRPGWVRDRGGVFVGFMCPTGEYIEAGSGNPFRLATGATVKDRAPAGTLKGWQTAANAALDQSGNFYWTIGLCAAFAGPLLALAGMSACGFNLSGESSRGKTLALQLGSSVWATPREKRGVLFSMNSTSNAIEDLASVGSESFLALDEIGAMSRPQDIPSILFGLSTGAGKSRKAGRGAGLAEDAEFLPFTMLTNERPLRSVVTDAGGDYKTGLSVRFPDLDVTGGMRVSADVIKAMEAVKANFGHAGPLFIRWMISEGLHHRGNEIRKRIDSAAKVLAGDATPAQARAANVFALVQIAGELACEAGILSDVKTVQNAVKTAWVTFKNSDEGKATEGEASLLGGFRSWLVRSMGGQIIAAEDFDAPNYREVLGWHTPKEFVLDWGSLANMQRMGLNGSRAGLVKALDDCGALVKSGKNSAHNKLPSEVGGGEVANLRINRVKLGV